MRCGLWLCAASLIVSGSFASCMRRLCSLAVLRQSDWCLLYCGGVVLFRMLCALA